MALIFEDTLHATDSTGLYTLQALVNGSWGNLETIAGPQNGIVEVGSTLNTIAVNTQQFAVGQTFDFRWVDSAGNESNVSSIRIPFTILGYYTCVEFIAFTNNGGDNWTCTIPYAPPSNDPSDTVANQVSFYSGTGVTQLVQQSGISSAQLYNFSGHGAGTYEIQVTYTNSANADFVLAGAFIMVDDSGNIERQLLVSGFTDVSYSGMNMSCTANYQATNAAIQYSGYLTLDNSFNNQRFLALGNPLVNHTLPFYNASSFILIYGLQIDTTQWTPGVGAPGQGVGCGMTVVTNMV